MNTIVEDLTEIHHSTGRCLGRRSGVAVLEKVLSVWADFRRDGAVSVRHRLRHGVAWRLRRIALRIDVTPKSVDSKGVMAMQPQSTGSSSAPDVCSFASTKNIILATDAYGDRVDETCPLVSVIMPAFKDALWIRDAVQSVLDQTMEDWELVIVEDGACEDHRLAIANLLHDRRIRLVRHGANRGLSSARNTGLAVSNGIVVQFLDADDMLLPDALELRIRALVANSALVGLAGAVGTIVQSPENLQLTEATSYASASPRTTPAIEDWLSTRGENLAAVHGPIIRRSVALMCGGFDVSIKNGAEDYEFWDRVLRLGYSFVSIGVPVGLYRQKRSGMIRESLEAHIANAEAVLNRSCREFVPESYMEPVSPAALFQLSEVQSNHYKVARLAKWAALSAVNDSALAAKLKARAASFFAGGMVLPSQHQSLRASVRGGFVRGMRLSPHYLVDPDEVSAVHAISNRIFDRILALSSSAPSDTEPHEMRASEPVDRGQASWGVVIERIADCEIVEQFLQSNRRPDETVVRIDVATMLDPQGVDDWWSARGLTTISLSQALVQGLKLHKLVLAPPVHPDLLACLSNLVASDVQVFVPAELANASNELCPSTGPDRPLSAEALNAAINESDTTLDVVLSTGRVEADDTKTSVMVAPSSRSRRISSRLHDEEGALDVASIEAIRSLKDSRLGETAVIIGNGPSLNETDLSLLRGVDTFGVNSIFLAEDRLPEPLTYYVVEDTKVMEENADRIRSVQAGLRLFPTDYQHYFRPEDLGVPTVFFRLNTAFYRRDFGSYCHPRFSFDPTQRLFSGQTVTYINMQLAHWIGYSRVVLIGMDFEYNIPADAEIEGVHIRHPNSPDPNHFHPDYFGYGKTWKDPQLERVRANYSLALRTFTATGRSLVNSTVGGRLDVFPRMPLATALNRR